MDCHLFNSAALLFVNLRRPCARLSDVCNFVQSLPIFKMSLTNVASVGSVFNDTRKVKVLSLPETIKEKSTFRAMALRRELIGSLRFATRQLDDAPSKQRIFL